MPSLLLPSRVRPSYKQGYARSAAAAAYPNIRKGLHGEWAFALGPTGVTAKDVSGRKRNGTLTDMDAATDWVRGDPSIGGYALDLVESDGIVNLGRGFDGPTGSYVASFRVDDPSRQQFIFGNRGTQYIYLESNGGNLSTRLADPATYNANGGTFTAGVWTSIGYTWGPRGIEVHKDGSQVANNAFTGGYTEDADFYLGGLPTYYTAKNYLLNGAITSFAHWDRQLLPNEFQFLSRQPLAPLWVSRRLHVSSSVTELYTREQSAALEAADADLGTAYSASDYTDVDTDNGVRVGQVASDTNFAVHLFKDYVGSQTSCTLTCNVQSDLAPTAGTVYLQIYNYNSTTWETKDSDSTSAADTDFTLTADIADLTNYKSAEFIACRVYQENA